MTSNLNSGRRPILQALLFEGIYLPLSAGMMILSCLTFFANTRLFLTLPYFVYCIYTILRLKWQKNRPHGALFMFFTHLFFLAQALLIVIVPLLGSLTSLLWIFLVLFPLLALEAVFLVIRLVLLRVARKQRTEDPQSEASAEKPQKGKRKLPLTAAAILLCFAIFCGITLTDTTLLKHTSRYLSYTAVEKKLTPYFLPDEAEYDAIRIASQRRNGITYHYLKGADSKKLVFATEKDNALLLAKEWSYLAYNPKTVDNIAAYLTPTGITLSQDGREAILTDPTLLSTFWQAYIETSSPAAPVSGDTVLGFTLHFFNDPRLAMTGFLTKEASGSYTLTVNAFGDEIYAFPCDSAMAEALTEALAQ